MIVFPVFHAENVIITKIIYKIIDIYKQKERSLSNG